MASYWTTFSPRITSRVIPVNDIDVFALEAFPISSTTESKLPLILLLHGFPELAFSWRKVMPALADAGYHVVAPDRRGFGRTTSSNGKSNVPVKFDDDLSPYRVFNGTADIVGLVYSLGYSSVAAVIGHDSGSEIAGLCALIRPDLFKAVVMMSAPFSGPPPISANTTVSSALTALRNNLASLQPPRKHYVMYYSTPEANAQMQNPPQGLRSFFRAYYHVKSADWKYNQPHRLPSPSAKHLAVMPHYYIMPLDNTMPGCIESDAPSMDEIAKNAWLTEGELEVYVAEYSRTGFQGGLNRYRCGMDEQWSRDLLIFSEKRIEVPAMFISGKQDWGVYQWPGAVEKMKGEVCEKMEDEDFVLVDGAGHWVQQEKPELVTQYLLRFLGKVGKH